jgi:hypothetical protein
MDMGVASPRAQGQAMMRTATAFTKAGSRAKKTTEEDK